MACFGPGANADAAKGSTPGPAPGREPELPPAGRSGSTAVNRAGSAGQRYIGSPVEFVKAW